jgi:hypothetical protein
MTIFKESVSNEGLRREFKGLEIRFDAKLKKLEMWLDAKIDRRETKPIGEITLLK